jgi:uncharacterized membrane protein YraQ (UPF0718 family)
MDIDAQTASTGFLSGLSAGTLFASLIWGGVATGICVYGWKQKAAIPLACGAAMAGVTYVVGSAFLMSAASIAILGVMYWLLKRD